MKKNILRQAIIVMMASATLLGCKKANPDYNPETKEVSAQFVLNVAAAEKQPETKMTAAAVQRNFKFRGIDNAVILAYNTEGGSNPYVKLSSSVAEKRYDMGALYTSQASWTDDEKTSGSTNNTHSQRVLHLNIPIGTDAVLFYGKATAAANATPKANGSSIMVIGDQASETEIKVVRRMDESKVTSYDQTAALMIFVVNRIIDSEVDDADDSDASLYGFPKADMKAVSWKSYGHQYEINNDLRAGTKKTQIGLEEILGKVYSTFTRIKTAEYRAGSSDAVKGMMQDMFAAIGGVLSASPVNAKEANAKRLAREIETRMNNYFSGDWTYKANSAIKSVAKGVLGGGMDDAAWDTYWNSNYGSASDLNDYPYGDFGVPEGAAQFEFNKNNDDHFSYRHPNAALVTPGATFEPRKYVYPAELMYYVNSPIRTTETANLQTTDFPDGVSNWDAWNKSGWTFPGKVLSTTRGVAVRYNINYGVSMLQSSVAWSAEAKSADAIKDNRSAMTDGKEGDREIALVDAKLALRGILVGGVNPRYNWQFLRKYTSGDFASFDGVIYDDELECSVVPTHNQEYNYTLVYDNYNSSGAQTPVYVALEFVNNGDDFWGRDNLIRSGAVFYLVAQLSADPDKLTGSGKQTITWPTDHQIPPIYGVDGESVPSGKQAGTSKQIPRVFIQDFMTSAVFRIGVNSLKQAYVTVPDLRSSQMSLGLSVDLGWSNGFEYDLQF